MPKNPNTEISFDDLLKKLEENPRRLTRKLTRLFERIAQTDDTHEEIAGKFCVKNSTIKNQEEALRKIFGVDSRVKLVIIFYKIYSK